jgi:hypothetical protein
MQLWFGLLAASSAAFSQSIEGTVADSVTGLPVGRAKVTVEAAGKSVYQASTDDQGVFRIQPVKFGTYAVSFSKPEFLPSTSIVKLDLGSDSIHLQGRLTPWSSVAGRVVDASGHPVSGAELLLDGSLTGQTATSDNNGNFRFRVAPGTYVLSARPSSTFSGPPAVGDERLGWTHTYYPGVLDRYAAVRISVKASSDVWEQDIVLSVARLGRVRGTVLDDNGDPAPNVRVQAARTDETLFDEIQAVSKADGSFEFLSLPDGEWRVFAETEGPAEKLRASAVVHVAGHDLDRVDLRLVPPFAMTGKVSLVGAEDAKPEKTSVAIFLRPLVAGSEGLSQTTTDSNGNFRINNVYPGRYKIIAASLGPRYFLNSIQMGNRELLGQYVDLMSGGILPVEIKFESEGGGVRGTVEDCGSGTVVLAPQDSALQEPQFVHATRCGLQGRFQFANVRPGDYYAFAFDRWEDDPELLSSLDQSLINKAIRIRVDRGMFIDVDLRITSRNP